jgi:peptidylprolyl isomerase
MFKGLVLFQLWTAVVGSRRAFTYETGMAGAMTAVLLQTTMGDVRIELFDDTMPITAGNFRKLVEKRFYDGTIFHRVIPSFMIQGGDPEGTGMGGPGYSIKDELPANNRNARGTISMANAGPNTGGSQFFINVVDNNRLDRKHPVFGRVVSGMEVVDAISRTPRDDNDRPRKQVDIKKASVLA